MLLPAHLSLALSNRISINATKERSTYIPRTFCTQGSSRLQLVIVEGQIRNSATRPFWGKRDGSSLVLRDIINLRSSLPFRLAEYLLPLGFQYQGQAPRLAYPGQSRNWFSIRRSQTTGGPNPDRTAPGFNCYQGEGGFAEEISLACVAAWLLSLFRMGSFRSLELEGDVRGTK